MLLTPRAIEHVADRIERAYLRRCSQWRHAHLDPRLWVAAAELLVDVNRREAWVPLDPELFVASQVENAPGSDPWLELTRPSSQIRYMSRVRKIVRGLRRELRRELRQIEVALQGGESLEVVLLGPSRGLTALGRYLAACQYGRTDLAYRFRHEARDQDAACPLYRQSALGLIPDHAYPIDADPAVSSMPGHFSLN